MARIEERALIAVPREVVFDYRLDFASNLATYNRNVRDVEQILGNERGVGATYRLRVRLAPGFAVTSTLTVTEATRPQRISDRAESRTGNAEEIVSFASVEVESGNAATEVCFVVITRPQGRVARVADRVLAGLGRRQVRIELESMRKHLEARAGN